MFGPAYFGSAPEECWIFILVNIHMNFASSYWDGVTKILNLLIQAVDSILVKWNC